MKVSCVKKVIDNCPVPPIVDPLGKSWNQPNPHNFVWDEDCVAMSEHDYKSLHTYDCALPTGIYEGKMWKTHIRKKRRGRSLFVLYYRRSGKCSILHH